MLNRSDQEQLQLKLDPGVIGKPEPHLGKIDAYGNYLITMPTHHVVLDERNFFSRYIWVDRFKNEKEGRICAFCKLPALVFNRQ